MKSCYQQICLICTSTSNLLQPVKVMIFLYVTTVSLINWDFTLTLFRISLFKAAHIWWGAKRPPPFPKICHTVTDIPQWWNLAQEQTNNTINTLTEEIKEIHQSFKKPELEIIVVKKVNDALVKQLSSVEQQCWKNAKYSHQECVEIVGITFSVKHDQLEPTVCRILHHIGVNITGVKVEACHWLGKNSDRTTATFSSRKDYEHTMCVKK